MSITLTLSVACATLVCGQADTKDEPDAAKPPVTPTAPAAPLAPEVVAVPSSAPTDVKLVMFDGAHDFMKTSRRLRIWRDEVSFDMMVDAQGEATQCEVVNQFRKTYVNKKLCEVVMAHHTFEPARNAQNEAVEGSYRAKISYDDLRKELD